MARWRRLLLVALPLFAYATALANGFIWDDHHVIERGRLVASWRGVPALFVHDAMFSSDAGAFAARATVDTYRPLTMTTFAVEHALIGVRPLGAHATNLLLHLACVLLLVRVGRRLGLSEWASTSGALLFAVHPAVAEGIHYINGRSDPLCLLFFLVALAAWLRGRDVLAAAAFLLATLCKETAFVMAPPVLLLLAQRTPAAGERAPATGERAPGAHERAPLRARLRSWTRAAVPWAAGGAAGLLLRLHALGRPATSAGGRHVGFALLRVPELWLDGLRALVLPRADVAPDLHERYRVFALVPTLVALALVLALAAWALRRRQALLGWALATFLAALAPVALLTYDEGWFGWGRYLYPAAAAPALWAGYALVDRLLPRLRSRARGALVVGCALFVLLCAAQTLAAGRDYHDDRSFALALIADHPNEPHGYFELGTVELREGHVPRAVELAERAVAITPGYTRYWSLAANALMSAGRRDQAFTAAHRALALDPADVNGRYLVAIEALGAHREPEAAALLLDVLAAEPDQEGPWRTLAAARAHLGPASAFVVEARRRLTNGRYAAIAPRARALLGD